MFNFIFSYFRKLKKVALSQKYLKRIVIRIHNKNIKKIIQSNLIKLNPPSQRQINH